MIIRGGFNIYPRARSREVLYEHPAVAEAAVVGLPDDTFGEEVGAAVTLKEGAEATPEEPARVRQGARRRLQNYPRVIWFVPGGLPKARRGRF